jgi:hypothetical protein
LWVETLKDTILHQIAVEKEQLTNGLPSQDYTALKRQMHGRADKMVDEIKCYYALTRRAQDLADCFE